MRFYSQAQKIPVGQSMFSVIEFTFSKEWRGLNKIAQFKQYSNAYNVEITDDQCYVPSELFVGKCSLRIRGYSEDQQDIIATANELILTCVQGFESGGVPPVPPTPDLYQKLIANVNADFDQNDPLAKDYIKNRTHSSNPQYILQGTDYLTWTQMTQYAQIPIPKAVVNGVEYYNVKATKYFAFASHLLAQYELPDGVIVSVYADEKSIVPAMEMYSYDPGTSPLSPKYIPQIIDWSSGDAGNGEYIKNRYGGFIEPSDTVIGTIERVAADSTGILSDSAYDLIWKEKAPNLSDAVRIAGVYMDGTPFDSCCLYGAFDYKPDSKLYGANPFRFNKKSYEGEITKDVVEYATIYSATLHKHPDWTLPRLSDADNPNWGLAKRAFSFVGTDKSGWSPLGQDSKGEFYSQVNIRVIPALKSMTELMNSIGMLYQINSADIIGALLEDALGAAVTPPFRVFTRKVPDSSGTTFGFDIEDVGGDWVYMLFSPYSPNKPQSTTVIKRAFYSLQLTVNMQTGRAENDMPLAEFMEKVSTSRSPAIIFTGDQPIWQTIYEGPLPIMFVYLAFNESKMRQYIFNLDGHEETVTYRAIGYLEDDIQPFQPVGT